MRRFPFCLPAVLIGLIFLLASILFTSIASSDPKPIQLVSIQVKPDPEGAAIEIQADQPFSFVTYTLTGPDRLIVDWVDVQGETTLPESYLVRDDLVRGWEAVRDGPPEDPGRIDYLSFEFNEPAEHRVKSNSNLLVIQVRPKGRKGPLNFAFDFSLFESEEAPSRISAAPGPNGWDLGAAIAFGLDRHRPIRTAREEILLAQMKMREAHRALFPAATLKGSWTDGTASNVAFREISAGLQLEQPIYYSGRLREAYRQSILNLQVSEKRQGKVKADFTFEIAQAYYQWIGAKVGLIAQEGAVRDSREFFEQTKLRYDKELLTRLEFLNVESQVNQTRFQRATAENDLALARLKFLQRLNLEPGAAAEIPDEFPAVSSVRSVDLEEALQMANQYRPDIQINRLLVEFNTLEERIARAKTGLKVDLSAFYGTSGSAFETEPLDLGDDYFLGLKASRAWGPHGATLSTTTTKTSPRLGQTTRTDSTVYSGELGLYNQLQGLSEIQQARIALAKAQQDLDEVKATVYQEVQEAFISYEKARLQLEYAGQKVAFREEQIKILKAQASLNEILPSQVLEAILKLADEKTAQAQALTNHHVALARLNKAIGLPGHYR